MSSEVKLHTASVVDLLNGLVTNLTDHEPELLGPVDVPLQELSLTLTLKTEDGLKGVILAGYTNETGLDVYERYGSCQRYEQIATAFQKEVDYFKETSPNHTIEDLE